MSGSRQKRMEDPCGVRSRESVVHAHRPEVHRRGNIGNPVVVELDRCRRPGSCAAQPVAAHAQGFVDCQEIARSVPPGFLRLDALHQEAEASKGPRNPGTRPTQTDRNTSPNFWDDGLGSRRALSLRIPMLEIVLAGLVAIGPLATGEADALKMGPCGSDRSVRCNSRGGLMGERNEGDLAGGYGLDRAERESGYGCSCG